MTSTKLMNNIEKCFSKHGDREQRELISKSMNKNGFGDACLAICNSASSVSTKRWAHEACAMMPGKKFAIATRNGLQSDAMTIRLHTLIGISCGHVPSRINWLFDMLDDESGGIRLNALESLLVLRPNATIKVLAKNDERQKELHKKGG